MATGNLHKISEVKDILNSLNVEVEIVSPKQLDPSCDEPVEDGKSFKDNSYIKAKYYHDLFNLQLLRMIVVFVLTIKIGRAHV